MIPAGIRAERGIFLATKKEDLADIREVRIVDYASMSNCTSCARGSSPDQLFVQVCRRMYCFHESEPASRPPPVSFSPPNAPPISAPLVPMLTLAMPQSDPRTDRKCSE